MILPLETLANQLSRVEFLLKPALRPLLPGALYCLANSISAMTLNQTISIIIDYQPSLDRLFLFLAIKPLMRSSSLCFFSLGDNLGRPLPLLAS